jgi:hypothetical protein
LKHRWNPLLPKSIYKELRKFSTYGKRIKKDELNNFREYVYIDISPDGEITDYSMPSMFIDFESLYNYINSVMEKINEWLDAHEAAEIKFNGEG